MDKKKVSRLRRARRARMKIKELGAVRLVVNRTSRHMYAQITSADGSRVLATASTLEKGATRQLSSTGNKAAAELVGQHIAERAAQKGVKSVAFDRSGFKYHGRVASLAESARKAGLRF